MWMDGPGDERFRVQRVMLRRKNMEVKIQQQPVVEDRRHGVGTGRARCGQVCGHLLQSGGVCGMRTRCDN